MPELMKKAAVWLGLVGDDRFDEDQAAQEEYSESVYVDSRDAPQVDAARPQEIYAAPAAGEPPVRQQVTQTADLARIISVRPRTYNEARTIGENFRDGTPVIMNLSDMDDSDAKRLVDFAAGLIFGLHGSIDRVTSKVFLLTPHNVHVTAEDRQRLATSSFFNQS
ncbi:cell division inhibitor SepF [Propionibacterium cyclohexanicum]|uniref:Cell division protein SepF n=1 Tax=Propionibacterium cyclohexanicum TaxID=64702 RepID=A0A1H9PKT9_9ACTN|nr:cell division protein SepF [Propionibacterium cyclohexanicum]SER48429.1 cell division inhibitor SepF [Propionibacterium cyclohexanicum]